MVWPGQIAARLRALLAETPEEAAALFPRQQVKEVREALYQVTLEVGAQHWAIEKLQRFLWKLPVAPESEEVAGLRGRLGEVEKTSQELQARAESAEARATAAERELAMVKSNHDLMLRTRDEENRDLAKARHLLSNASPPHLMTEGVFTVSEGVEHLLGQRERVRVLEGALRELAEATSETSDEGDNYHTILRVHATAVGVGGVTDWPTCAHCDERPATCFGSYEGLHESYACSDCCGHANEDGRCYPLGETTDALAPAASTSSPAEMHECTECGAKLSPRAGWCTACERKRTARASTSPGSAEPELPERLGLLFVGPGPIEKPEGK